MRLGAKRYIEEDDMWPLPSADSAESLNARLDAAWQAQLHKCATGSRKRASLTLALIKAYGGPYLVAGGMKAIYDCLSFLQPQLLRLLLDFVQSYETTDARGEVRRQEPIRGFAIATSMFIAANAATFLLHQYFDRCFATTMRIRGGLVTLIYKKSLVLSNGEKGGRTTGDITNLQSVDATRVGDLTQCKLRSGAGVDLADEEPQRPAYRVEWSVADHLGVHLALSLDRMAVVRRCRHHGHLGKISVSFRGRLWSHDGAVASHQHGHLEVPQGPAKAADEKQGCEDAVDE